MNPVAMEPIGTKDQAEIVPPGANGEAENPAEAPESGVKYCIAVSGEKYAVTVEMEGASVPAEGEDAGLEGPAHEKAEGQSLGGGLSMVDALVALAKHEKERLAGGEASAQETMDQGFAGQGGGKTYA